MTVRVSVHGIKKAIARTFPDFSEPFDLVESTSWDSSAFSMHLPFGTGQSVADAINAAIALKKPTTLQESSHD